MTDKIKRSGSELFIIDNSDQDWKVLRYLRDWCQLSETIDIATGFFEIGSLLALDGEWQKIDQIRILMGDEVSKRTKKAFIDGLSQINARLDASIEAAKEKNDFLAGVPAIVDAIKSGKIKCRVYRKDKFHAKAYITRARSEVLGAFALVGSSNFTYPGLSDNVELNIQITGRQVTPLQEWYEEYWNAAEDVTPEVLRVIERHTREYSPFDVYAKSLQEFFRGHEMTADEWELTESKMYHVLDKYQQDGYHNMLKIAKQYHGAFLCDGVGLGKTFIGLMLIERLVMHDRKRVALFVPKAVRDDVWERDIKKYLPHISGIFSNFFIFNHTDLGRTSNDFPAKLISAKNDADVVIIDEAHHFRNTGIKGKEDKKPSRYRELFDLLGGPAGPKQMYMLTATPINNKLLDFRHMVELFSRKQDDYFRSTVGINSLQGHFNKMERELKKLMGGIIMNGGIAETNLADAQEVLNADTLFSKLVVQRSRDYVKRSQLQEGGNIAMFPSREAPRVAPYSIKKTYGSLLESVDTAFKKEKPLFVLSMYYPLAYYKGDNTEIEPMLENRQKEVVALIRTQFLKRFESSAFAFELSCERMLSKLLTWVTKHSETAHEKATLDRWRGKHADLLGYVKKRQLELALDDEEEADEDFITQEMLEAVDYLPREQFKVEEMLVDCYADLDQIVDFLKELKRFKPKNDDKLKALIKLLKTDPVLKQHKVLIFSEYAETARYLKKEMLASGIKGVEQIDSGIKKNRSEIIRRFSPYYNDSSTGELAAEKQTEIRVLISTDVLSEGLNLQDATRLINYDLHWNPVRLMQRIGRVDRRMSPDIEDKLIADHPEQKELRGKIVYWNFLPPGELETLLFLFTKVAHKTLRISKTLGIEGKKLLRPEDDWDALKEFNEKHDGKATRVEEMHLELRKLLLDNPDLAARLDDFPGRVFSGKQHPKQDTRAVFFCYRLPKPDYSQPASEGEPPWTEEAGETRWYLYNLADDSITQEPSEIIEFIRSTPDTPRRCEIEQQTLSEIRAKIDKFIKNTYLKSVQAPQSVKPILKSWMELN